MELLVHCKTFTDGLLVILRFQTLREKYDQVTVVRPAR